MGFKSPFLSVPVKTYGMSLARYSTMNPNRKQGSAASDASPESANNLSCSKGCAYSCNGHHSVIEY